MSVYSKFLELSTGASRQIDLSQNTLALLGQQLNGSSSGNITFIASATTTTYSVTWPSAQGSGYLMNNGSGVLSWSSIAGGANTALSNLASVAINTSLLPGTDNSINLGSSSFSWATANIHNLNDSSANVSINVYGRVLEDSSGATSIDWGNRLIKNASGVTSIDYQSHFLQDSSANTSVDYNNRVLYDSSVTAQLTWSTSGVEFNQLTATTVPYLNSSKILTSSAVTPTQLGYLSGASGTTGTGSVVFAASPTITGTLSAAAASFTGNLNMNSNSITSLATPVNPGDAVNKSYVDNFINATSWKTAVQLATTANITLSGEQTIDGTLTSSSRVLVKNQSTASQNGIYTSGSGSWTRTTDMSTWAEVPAAAVFVESGTVNADLGFVCTSQSGGTLGTTAITFVQFSSSGAYSADGTTLQLVSGVFSIKNGGVGTSQLGSITDGITLDQSGSGSTLEIKSGGVGTTQLAANSVTYAKLQQVGASSLIGNATGSAANATEITLGSTLSFSGSAIQTTAFTGDVTTSANSFATTISAGAVTATKLATVTDGITTDQNGSGSTIEVLYSPAVKQVLVAGQTFTANTSYAVRWGLTANGETSSRIYAADITTSSYDLFYVIGMASNSTSVSAGGNITVTRLGSFALSSSDTAFASNTDGAPVFLTASGTFSTTAPTTSGQAITRIGIIKARSATVTSNIIDVSPQTIGVN